MPADEAPTIVEQQEAPRGGAERPLSDATLWSLGARLDAGSAREAGVRGSDVDLDYDLALDVPTWLSPSLGARVGAQLHHDVHTVAAGAALIDVGSVESTPASRYLLHEAQVRVGSKRGTALFVGRQRGEGWPLMMDGATVRVRGEEWPGTGAVFAGQWSDIYGVGGCATCLVAGGTGRASWTDGHLRADVLHFGGTAVALSAAERWKSEGGATLRGSAKVESFDETLSAALMSLMWRTETGPGRAWMRLRGRYDQQEGVPAAMLWSAPMRGISGGMTNVWWPAQQLRMGVSMGMEAQRWTTSAELLWRHVMGDVGLRDPAREGGDVSTLRWSGEARSGGATMRLRLSSRTRAGGGESAPAHSFGVEAEVRLHAWTGGWLEVGGFAGGREPELSSAPTPLGGSLGGRAHIRWEAAAFAGTTASIACEYQLTGPGEERFVDVEWTQHAVLSVGIRN